MSQDILVERLFESLVAGDRTAARRIVDETMSDGASAEQIVSDLFWPTYERVTRLFRADQLTTVAHHMATRLLRVLTDQAALLFERKPSRGRTIFALCGPNDADELAAQMAVDLLEADGYEISFAGGGVANDEVLSQVQERRPDVLLLFASAPS
ncbi:MAG: B12-binding domain-containing protein, partial [Planctomycetota bacterium]|nr:B12-binding domain-containing protein [Planctomycetota bacterium]